MQFLLLEVEIFFVINCIVCFCKYFMKTRKHSLQDCSRHLSMYSWTQVPDCIIIVFYIWTEGNITKSSALIQLLFRDFKNISIKFYFIYLFYSWVAWYKKINDYYIFYGSYVLLLVVLTLSQFKFFALEFHFMWFSYSISFFIVCLLYFSPSLIFSQSLCVIFLHFQLLI